MTQEELVPYSRTQLKEARVTKKDPENNDFVKPNTTLAAGVEKRGQVKHRKIRTACKSI